MGKSDISHQYQQIQKYQKWAHKARWFLPFFAFFLLLISFWLPHFFQKKSAFLSVSDLQKNQKILDSQIPLMNSPKLVGTSGAWRYEITSQASHNVSKESTQINFISPRAKMENDQETLYGEAHSGRWLAEDEILELSGFVNLEHSKNYYVESDQVRIHTKEEVVYVPTFVQGAARFGKFEADEAQIEDQGQVIRLLGASHVTLLPQKDISPFSTKIEEKKEP